MVILRLFLILNSSALVHTYTGVSREILLYLLKNCCITVFHFTRCVCRTDRCSRHHGQQKKTNYSAFYSNIHEFPSVYFSKSIVGSCSLTLYFIEYTLFFRGILKLYIISKGYKKVPCLNGPPLDYAIKKHPKKSGYSTLVVSQQS